MADYDPTRLRQLGTRHKRLRKDLRDLLPDLKAEILAAHQADMPQVDIVEATGYTRDQIRQITLPPEKKRNRKVADRPSEAD